MFRFLQKLQPHCNTSSSSFHWMLCSSLQSYNQFTGYVIKLIFFVPLVMYSGIQLGEGRGQHVFWAPTLQDVQNKVSYVFSIKTYCFPKDKVSYLLLAHPFSRVLGHHDKFLPWAPQHLVMPLVYCWYAFKTMHHISAQVRNVPKTYLVHAFLLLWVPMLCISPCQGHSKTHGYIWFPCKNPESKKKKIKFKSN